MLLAGMRNWLAKPPAADPAPVAVAAPESADPVPPDRHALWPAARIEMAARLWGEGFIFPGGEEETLRIANPLGLSAASSLLLVGCGPGGPARAIASHLGVWVSGFEADPDLAAAGAALCAHAGLGRRAEIGTWDPADPRFAHRAYHHAIAFEAISGRAPETILGALALALRPGGQLALVQTVADAPLDAGDPMVRRWRRLAGRNTDVPAEATISRVLGRLGFEIRVVEDISQRHAKLAVRGWRDAVRALPGRPEATDAAVLVQAAEFWLLRVRLIRAGRLRVVRWHAMHRVAH